MVDKKISEFDPTTPMDADNVAIERLGAPPNFKVSLADILAFINNSNAIDPDQIMGRAIGSGNGPVVPLNGTQVMLIIGAALDIVNDPSPELSADLDALGNSIINLAHLLIEHVGQSDLDHVVDAVIILR